MKASTIYRTVANLRGLTAKERDSLIRAALRQRGDVLMALESARRRQVAA